MKRRSTRCCLSSHHHPTDGKWDAEVLPRLLARLSAELRALRVYATPAERDTTPLDLSQHLSRFQKLEHLFLFVPKHAAPADLLLSLSQLAHLQTLELDHLVSFAWEEPALMAALAEVIPRLEALQPPAEAHRRICGSVAIWASPHDPTEAASHADSAE
jgi:hypothetical protein